MKTNLRQFSFLFALLILGGPLKISATPLSKTDGPVKVQILHTNDGYQLYVDHHPFYIRGAGLESGDQQALAACGGNSSPMLQTPRWVSSARRSGFMSGAIVATLAPIS